MLHGIPVLEAAKMAGLIVTDLRDPLVSHVWETCCDEAGLVERFDALLVKVEDRPFSAEQVLEELIVGTTRPLVVAAMGPVSLTGKGAAFPPYSLYRRDFPGTGPQLGLLREFVLEFRCTGLAKKLFDRHARSMNILGDCMMGLRIQSLCGLKRKG